MKYVIRGYIEDEAIRYGVYDNQGQDEINHVPHQGLILLLDKLEHAVTICHILNEEDCSMNEFNDGIFRLGDIVEFVNEKPYEMGIIERTMGLYYIVNMVNKRGDLTGHKYFMHRNEIRHKNW